MHTMNTIEETRLLRLKMLRDELGSVAEIAKRTGISYAQISQWINESPDSKTGKIRNMRSESARLIENKLGKEQGWFDQPINNEAIDKKMGALLKLVKPLPTFEPGPDIKGKVPLISYVQAGKWSEIIEFMPEDAIDWFPCPVCHSNKTFALRVRGESMYNPHSYPSFRNGDLIFVDPEKQPVNGSFVVVRLEDENEATFKKLIIDGDKNYLSALNPAWPEPIIRLSSNATICGVVIFKGEIIAS